MERNDTLVDPLFDIPDGVKDFKPLSSKNASTPITIPDDSIYFIDNVIDSSEQLEDPSGYEALPTVQNITIVEQILRVSPDGNHLVDIIVEVDDFPGITSYEIRVSEA